LPVQILEKNIAFCFVVWRGCTAILKEPGFGKEMNGIEFCWFPIPMNNSTDMNIFADVALD